jgi:RimJ/RimL family protein N-acetyltransferase
MSDVVFTTARLAVRCWRHSDLDAIFAVYGDAEAMRWVGDGQVITMPECERWLEVTLANYRKYGYGMFALESPADAFVIGFAGIVHPGGQQEPEVKYALRRSHWGKGFATEAVEGLLAYGAGSHALARIIATTAPDNGASHRVLMKAGFVRGALRDNDDGSQTQLFVWGAQGARHVMPPPEAEA